MWSWLFPQQTDDGSGGALKQTSPPGTTHSRTAVSGERLSIIHDWGRGCAKWK